MTTTEAWKKFQRTHSRGEVITGSISKIADFGLFIDLNPEVFGIVHLSDLDWNDPDEESLKRYNIGDTIDAVILSIEPEIQRVCSGIKQMRAEPDSSSDDTPPEEPQPVRPRSPKSPNPESEAAKYE